MALSEQQQSTPVGIQGNGALPTEPQEAESIDIGELLQVLYRRRRLMQVVTLGIFILGMIYALMQHPMYESVTTILVTANSGGGGGGNANMPLLSELQALTQSRSVETQVEILTNPDLLEQAFMAMPKTLRLEGFGLESFDPQKTGKRVIVGSKKNTDIVTITVRASTARSAAAYANSIAHTYLVMDLAQNRQATQQARSYVEKQLETVRGKFNKESSALAAFKEKSGLVAPDDQLSQLAQSMATLQAEIDTTRADIVGREQSLATVQAQLGKQQTTVTTETTVVSNPRVSASLERIDTLNSERVRLLQDFQPSSPEVKAVDVRIVEEKRYLKQLTADVIGQQTNSRNPLKDELLTNYTTGLAEVVAEKSRLKIMDQTYQSRSAQLKHLPSDEKRLAELMMNVDIQKNTVDLLAAQNETLLISEQATLPNIRVVAVAREPNSPRSPRKWMYGIFFLVLGLLCSAAAAALVEFLDELIHDQETAERLTGLTTLGTIHAMGEDEPKVIGVDDQRSVLVDRFRVLRNNISFSSLERKIRTIAITSTGPGEGKSTCCTNLGIVMALDGKRVLIVDCDLHRPSIHTLLKAPRGVGFTNVVMGTTTLEEATVSTDYPGLSFLPAGILPPNPSEVLNAHPTRQLFRTMADQYDVVILDCPPCAKLSDVQILSTIADGMLLLVGVNQTFKRGLAHAYIALAQVSAPFIGMVCNRLDLHQQRYGYYGYYYGYYGTYGKYGRYGYDRYDNYGSEGSETPEEKTKSRRHKKR